MRTSTDRMLTTHAGSLPRPADLIELNARRNAGEDVDEAAYQARLREATVEVVQRQVDLGIDVPGDGEFGKAMGEKVNYGAWWFYSFSRLSGLGSSVVDRDKIPQAPVTRSKIQLGTFPRRRDREIFREAYSDPEAGVGTSARTATTTTQPALPVVDGPITYTGHDQIKRDIDNFRAALDAAGAQEGFMTALGPASCSRIGNSYYQTDEEFVWACAEAMREEYKAITDAGIILQIDEPCFAENFDQFNPEPSIEDYIEFTRVRVEALNHALEGIPEELTRFHLCWGSWHGPHTTDIPLKHLLPLLLEINTGSYSFEAGNVRHEHEWKVWEGVKLDGKILVPGVVSHATNVVEHPEVVADRIERFANVAGKENVIAATDCGLGGRVHEQIAWAKLETLAQGAKLATERLY